jgi:hypothetical protein
MEHEELKLKIESIKNETNNSLEMEQSISCAIPIFKVDASTSCNNLIDESCSNPCNEKCFENVVVESCDDLISKENDELKREVERIMRDLARLKGKSIVEPSQDNFEDMVKKLEKGATVTCFKCHQKGHNSYKCPQPKKMVLDEKNKKSFTIKNSLIYTKPNRKNKSKSTSYAMKKRKYGKLVAHKVGKKDWSWNRSIWMPKEVITNMKGPEMVWVPKKT